MALKMVSLSSMYGTQLDPTRVVLTRHAIVGYWVINTITQSANTSLPNPSGQIITVWFSSLSQDMVLVPGTARHIYDVTLTRGTDLTARFVSNLGRTLIERLTIRMQGKELKSLQSYGNSWAMRDFYLTTTQRTAIDYLL